MMKIARPAVGCVTALALVAVLSDCAVGPNFKRPAAPAASGYGSAPTQGEIASSPGAAGGAPQRFVAEMDIPAQWWTLFQSPKLNGLVEQAIKANPDMAAAKAALMGWRPMTLFERATSSMITSDIGVPMPPTIDAVKSTLIGGAPRRPVSAAIAVNRIMDS